MPWLPEAMESLLRQTTDAFEILAIVDGSTDSSADYLHTLRATALWDRLRILEQPYSGVTATLNRLLSEVRTPWLARMDADDVSYPTRIRKLLEVIEECPDAGILYSLADYHPRERCAGRFRSSRGTPEQLRSIVENGYLLSICHPTVALCVQKARAVGGYRMEIHAEDADLWWRMARRYEIRMIPEALVGFRQNSGSVSTRNFRRQQLAGMYVQYLLLSDLWGLTPRPFADIAAALARFLEPSATRARESLRRFNMELAQGRRLRACAALLQSAWNSPRYLLTRVRDEFHHAAIANGVDPRLFWKQKDVLWS